MLGSFMYPLLSALFNQAVGPTSLSFGSRTIR